MERLTEAILQEGKRAARRRTDQRQNATASWHETGYRPVAFAACAARQIPESRSWGIRCPCQKPLRDSRAIRSAACRGTVHPTGGDDCFFRRDLSQCAWADDTNGATDGLLNLWPQSQADVGQTGCASSARPVVAAYARQGACWRDRSGACLGWTGARAKGTEGA